MSRLLQRYATPFITGLFLVSLISGVALYLGVGQSLFHEMHEILSLVLIVPFVLHVWKNWRPMMGYLGRLPMTIGLAASLVAAVAFMIPTGEGGTAGGPPQFALAQQILAHSPAEVAPALGTTPEALVDRLTAAGFAVTGPDESLSDIAAASGQDTFAIVAALLPAQS
ncbi:DUF4405 domain-containing protein [Rubellimicrobium aerolatum]|uniref:DUF4405 domain-containing protein n=1 Tax=Rubellimicrobium aerolatum TaxID=490979 RepID=A0ABW0S9A1_9RHOB|nr:DUF4405 domain-containing protein [Rubellimicrobium aerolatum]MBP1804875.1 hypothetical protein [Rubellimicrobium aerolatum]